MGEVKFTEDHEWIRIEDADTAVIGISDYAQEQLGEIVFVELPAPGHEVEKGHECAVIESVKAAGELKAPVDGTVLEINEILADEPERVNNDAMGDGWFMRLRVTDLGDIEELMDEDAYQAYVEGLG
ncbi:MAG: glycine cleavage system H protein [Gammaproteobacteria bacterium]|jgi:glycine cleavage system H protein